MQLHPDVEVLAFLLGTWRGEGRGEYPTVAPFAYGEEIGITHVGKPHLVYRQRTWRTDDASPLHAEVGYWRPGAQGRVELVLAHPTGIAEIEEGTVDGRHVELVTSNVAGTATAKEVNALRRVIDVDDDTLRYRLDMAAVGHPLVFHLEAELHRVG